MIVYKFGGASIRDAESIIKMTKIVQSCKQNIIVVASAMGKTTNCLEKILDAWFYSNNYSQELNKLIFYHENIISNLFKSNIPKQLYSMYEGLENKLKEKPSLDYNYEYDQIVSFGEVFSTQIIATFFNSANSKVKYVDIRNIIKTDRNFHDASIIWDLTTEFAKNTFTFKDHRIYVTQGFIAASTNNQTTTLGREGSDFSAAILANCCNAKKLIVWKDVPGIMNADPDWFPHAEKIETLSYAEAIELTYYGAKIIHPKTIKPLENKNIPLWVNSFLNPSMSGTLITQNIKIHYTLPVYIKKQNQILVSVKQRQAGFIADNHVNELFGLISHLKLTVQLTQMSALSFTVCIDENKKAYQFIGLVKEKFEVRYNTNVEIITIRNHTPQSIENIKKYQQIIIEQKTRKTVQFVVLDSNKSSKPN